MTRRQRLVHVQDGRDSRVVMLTLSPCGAVEACGVPATNWHAWSDPERRFVQRVGLVNDALRRGKSLRALAAHYEAMLRLVEQLEAAEALNTATAEGSA
jgi:hypothetical protein